MITEVNDKVNHEDGDDNKPLESEEDNRTESNVSVPDDFLDANISYMYPSFTCSVQNNVITLTLEVKNVSPDSFTKKLFSDPQAVAFKFSSIGSGYVPFHHAFAIQFLAPGSFDEDQLEVDFWDNNVVIQFPFSVNMEAGYKVGPSLSNMVDVLHKLESYDMDTTEENIQKSKKKKSKYQTEKHPKAMKSTKVNDEKKVDADYSSKDTKKIRYCSGDSVDSSMSESPMETIQLEYPDEDYDDDEDMRTEDSCDEDLHLVAPPRYKRAISEDSQIENKPRRGILKKRISVHGTGGRFRCYSESNMEDLGLNSSNDKLSFALSEATISEDDTYNFANSKKKAEKKKRALERRMSEGDAGSFEAINKMNTSSSLDLSELQQGWENESHEDSGMSSSYEEII